MKLILITDSFPPVRNSGAIQMRDLSRELAKQGHEVLVLTPSSEIDSSYRLSECAEKYEKGKVQVLHLKALQNRDIGYLRRAISEFLMPFIMLFRLRNSHFYNDRFDGMVTYAPSIFFGPLASWLKKRNKCKNYLIIRDIFPQWAVDVGILSGSGLPFYLLKKVEYYLYSTADIIGVQTPANLNYFNSGAVNNLTTVEVLQNWLAEGGNRPCTIVVQKTILAGRKIFVYAGNIGDAQGLSIFIDLADKLRENDTVGFLFVGRGESKFSLKQEAIARKLDNILFFDEINPDEIPALYQQCSVGIISLDLRHKTHNIPGKFLSYMQAGLPVLAVINKNNDLEKIITNNQVGCVTTSHSIDVLLDFVKELTEDSVDYNIMGTRCKNLYEKMFTPSVAAKQVSNGLV